MSARTATVSSDIAVPVRRSARRPARRRARRAPGPAADEPHASAARSPGGAYQAGKRSRHQPRRSGVEDQPARASRRGGRRTRASSARVRVARLGDHVDRRAARQQAAEDAAGRPRRRRRRPPPPARRPRRPPRARRAPRRARGRRQQRRAGSPVRADAPAPPRRRAARPSAASSSRIHSAAARSPVGGRQAVERGQVLDGRAQAGRIGGHAIANPAIPGPPCLLGKPVKRFSSCTAGALGVGSPASGPTTVPVNKSYGARDPGRKVSRPRSKRRV